MLSTFRKKNTSQFWFFTYKIAKFGPSTAFNMLLMCCMCLVTTQAQKKLIRVNLGVAMYSAYIFVFPQVFVDM